MTITEFIKDYESSIQQYWWEGNSFKENIEWLAKQVKEKNLTIDNSHWGSLLIDYLY